MDKEYRKNSQDKQGNYFLNASKVKGGVLIKFLHPISFTKNAPKTQKSIFFKVTI